MTEPVAIQRPECWQSPFSPDMGEADADRILAQEPFSRMDPARFSPSVPLRELVRNDMRLSIYEDGDIIVRAGDYGTSAFLIVAGQVRVILPPGLSEALLGRHAPAKRGALEALAQLWRNPRVPEVRDPTRYGHARGTGARQDAGAETRIFLADVPAVLDSHGTVTLGPGEMFGEIAALARTARSTTIIAEGGAEVVEIRRQGVREIRARADDFRDHVDRLYRERSLKTHLRETPIFRHVGDDVVDRIADATLFETYGDFAWHKAYKRIAGGTAAERLAEEPVIAREGDYPDGLLLVRSGFVRVSRRLNHGERIVRYAARGLVLGFEEIAHNWRRDEPVGLQHTFRSVGYTDILRVPTAVVERHVLPQVPPELLPAFVERRRELRPVPVDKRSGPAPGEPRAEGAIETGILEFMVENRYINGTATMLIDLDRCVHCDACVEACAVSHNNNPRFTRHGPRHRNIMVANACMHCADPVCMIGCPTSAIHRSTLGGQVVINDDTCIGCGNCAGNCPYDNIHMVEIRDGDGNFVVDAASGAPIAKATKCDLCIDQPGGPACQRACPHDALVRIDMSDTASLAIWLNR